jgi:hypothetical protein
MRHFNEREETRMENLTLLHQVLKQTSPDPQAAHTVVVFETRSGSGEEFCYEIAPGAKAPKKSLFERFGVGASPNYWAYAVSAAPSINTQFTTDVLMDDSVHTFTLTIDLTYTVSEPRLLVIRRNDDPLKLLRDKAIALLQREIVRRPWDHITDRFRVVEQDVVSIVLPSLRQFAMTCGLRVLDVGLHRRIPEEYNISNVTGHRIETVDAAAEIRKREDAYRRARELADAAADTLTVALKNSAAGIQNPAELLQAVTSLSAAVEQMRGVSGGLTGGAAQLAPPAAVAQLQLTAGRQSGIGAVLAEMIAKTEPMACVPAEKNELRAAMLHLVAELIVEMPNQDAVKAARERVRTAGAAINVTSDQAEFVDAFGRTSSLRQRLQ